MSRYGKFTPFVLWQAGGEPPQTGYPEIQDIRWVDGEAQGNGDNRKDLALGQRLSYGEVCGYKHEWSKMTRF